MFKSNDVKIPGAVRAFSADIMEMTVLYLSQLSANNEEGASKWSDAVCYKTLPDKPGAPPKPQIKGKVHASSFRVTWGM